MTYLKIYGTTEQEATNKAIIQCKNLGIMRQPKMTVPKQLPDGRWYIEISYWGLD